MITTYCAKIDLNHFQRVASSKSNTRIIDHKEKHVTQTIDTDIRITDPKLIQFTPGTLRVIKRDGHVVEFDQTHQPTTLRL